MTLERRTDDEQAYCKIQITADPSINGKIRMNLIYLAEFDYQSFFAAAQPQGDETRHFDFKNNGFYIKTETEFEQNQIFQAPAYWQIILQYNSMKR